MRRRGSRRCRRRLRAIPATSPERYFAQIDRAARRAIVALARIDAAVLDARVGSRLLWGEGRPATLSSAANATAAKWHAEKGIYLMWGPGVEPSRGHTRHRERSSRCAPRCCRCSACRAAAGIAGPPLPGAPAPAGNRRRLPAGLHAGRRAADRVGGAPTAVDRGNRGEAAGARLHRRGRSGERRPSAPAPAGSFNNEGLLLKEQGRTAEAHRGVRAPR